MFEYGSLCQLTIFAALAIGTAGAAGAKEVSPLERLMAIEEIKQLKGRYQRALDNSRWDEFADCLAEDFWVMETGLEEPIRGRDEVLAQVRRSVETYGGWKHHAILPQIEITSDTTAKGTWTFAGSGSIYEDEYVRVDGNWKVKSARVILTPDHARSVMELRGGDRSADE